jgi:hypothetical protein
MTMPPPDKSIEATPISRQSARALPKAVRVSLVVGPLLIAINNLDYLMMGVLPKLFALKLLLSFAVPFGVSLYSSKTAGQTLH